MTDRNETGDDGTLIVNDRNVPFTNATYDLSFDSDSSNFSDGLSQDTAYTAKEATGSIEADGSKQELKSMLLDERGEPVDDIRILITGSEGGDRFTDITLENFGREFPGDGKTSTVIDWRADKHRPISN